MAQLSDDCFAFGGQLMSVDEAMELIKRTLTHVTSLEPVPLGEADGRVLAENVLAPQPLPPFDNSAVDGWAVAFADLNPNGETRLPIGGRIALPSSINTYISVFKNTALMVAISVEELTNVAKQSIDLDFKTWEMIAVIAVTYLTLVWTMSALIRLLERRLRLPETS